jgi:hypothetical protein
VSTYSQLSGGRTSKLAEQITDLQTLEQVAATVTEFDGRQRLAGDPRGLGLEARQLETQLVAVALFETAVMRFVWATRGPSGQGRGSTCCRA